MTSTYTEPGKRRADFPAIGTTVEATRPADPWDTRADVPPAGQAAPKPMLEDALRYLDDRLDRLESSLGEVNGVIMRAGHQLTPLLTDGEYPEASRVDQPTDPTPEDRRSTIARRVSAYGDRTDRLAEVALTMADQLRAILDTLEV